MNDRDDSQELDLDDFLERVSRRNAGQDEFLQSVREVAADVVPFLRAHPEYGRSKLLERMTEPDQVVSFRICWQDDDGTVQVNRAWRVQFNNAIGPYKGGLRFDGELTESTLKFLGFEQCFKNALTGLPIGGAKGGSDFDPKGRSDDEIMRFCQALMSSMYHYIGPQRDIPAGDVGVGTREVGFLFGEYRRLTHQFVGALTGKGVTFGGSELRVEATGYGVIYIVEEVLDRRDESIEGKRIVISGAGNVARYAAEKAIERGARVVAMSDSKGFMHSDDGLTADELELLHEAKEGRDGTVEEVAEEIGWRYESGQRPWNVACDIALPCAIQNELHGDDAERLTENGCRLVAEGANMPCTEAAIEHFQQHDEVIFVPGKAANAGGVAVSGLERTQNAQNMPWSKERVDSELVDIMKSIHARCLEHGRDENGSVDYRRGANIAGFVRLANAMLAQGVM
ncbi:MAG: NADP-specific glutamate dehydrogenase [Wenzhouxiangellaceae bacterium]|nr:NADP-specific glutamate dehydrogenase [Wenzhouxiangellaceae bacterium]